MRREIAYQVIGGTKFYERAEIKDAIAYLSLLANPFDAVASRASPTRLAAASGRPRSRGSLGLRGQHRDVGLGCGRGARAGSRARRRSGEGAAAVHGHHGRLRERAEHGLRVASCSRRCCAQTGYLEALEAERTIEAQGRIENLEQLVEVGARVRRRRRRSGEDDARRLPAADRARRRRRRAHRRRGTRDADDTAQRQGPGVPDRVHRRLRGRRLPPLARDRRGRAGGGAAPVLRRRHARDARSST